MNKSILYGALTAALLLISSMAFAAAEKGPECPLAEDLLKTNYSSLLAFELGNHEYFVFGPVSSNPSWNVGVESVFAKNDAEAKRKALKRILKINSTVKFSRKENTEIGMFWVCDTDDEIVGTFKPLD